MCRDAGQRQRQHATAVRILCSLLPGLLSARQYQIGLGQTHTLTRLCPACSQATVAERPQEADLGCGHGPIRV